MHVGSVVTHPLFQGPGTVLAIHTDQQGQPIFKVLWQSINRIGFHSGDKLCPISLSGSEQAPDV